MNNELEKETNAAGGKSLSNGLLDCFIPLSERYPEPSCDINDLLLWCPDHGMGMQLVLGQYDGKSFTADFEVDDDMNEIRRENLYVTHWMPAPHMGPNPKDEIVMLAEAI